MESEDNTSSLRVESFSCYLNAGDDNLMLKFAGSISPEQTPCPINLGRSKNKEGELSIFGADKYFNMKMDYDQLKPNFRQRTPSVRSEESSWNSQTALLQNLQRNSSQVKQKRSLRRRFFPSFGCNGTCSDQELAVIPVTKQSQSNLKIGDQFAFPILNSGIQNVKEEEEEEEPRKSLEVFGAETAKKGDIAANLERKLSILTWDAIPKSESLLSSTMCDDMASDASSDLFEIENISAGIGYPLLSRQASGNMSSCMSPTITGYAPSEASIEWSVITTSTAADFSSVVSDYDDKNMSEIATNKTAKAKNREGKEGQKGHPARLLGCRSHKAVRVAESAYRSTNEKSKHPARAGNRSCRA